MDGLIHHDNGSTYSTLLYAPRGMCRGKSAMRLENGNRVVIVGGGPAGSCAALQLLRLASEAALQLEVIVLEARDFSRPGPAGCNKCAGILSSAAVRRLEALDLTVPPDVVQAELDAYILHLGRTELPIYPPDPARRIYSVYRGGGPRLGGSPCPHSFDGWLLDQARERGAIVRRSRVRTIRAGVRPIVVTPKEQIEADLVVLATGVNSPTPIDPAWGYKRPQTETMAQDEVPMPSGLTAGVHIYFGHPRGLIFGALIPKGRFASISLLGHGLPHDAVSLFLEEQGLLHSLPNVTTRLCGCTSRVVVSPASGFYADRFVTVGDAAVTRLYKDGIGAAFHTAEVAMRTAIERGVSRAAFEAGYRPTCQRIAVDNWFGQLLFRLWNIPRSTPFLLSAWQRTLQNELAFPVMRQVHTNAMWGIFTGDESYRRILIALSHPAAVLAFLRGMLMRSGAFVKES